VTASDPQAAPLVEGIFRIEVGEQPVLLTSRCNACDARFFPPRERCNACSSEDLRVEDASQQGELYTWTTIRELGGYREGFTPYTVGQVDLSDGLRVTGILKREPDALRIGMPMRLCLVSHGDADEGKRVVGYAFAPA